MRYWSEEELNYVWEEKENGVPYKNLTDDFNKKFNKNRTIDAIRQAYHRKRKNLSVGKVPVFWTRDKFEFIRKLRLTGENFKDITKQFNIKFNCNKTKKAIAGTFYNFNGSQNNIVTHEEKRFIKNHYNGDNYKELRELFNKEFEKTLTTQQIRDRINSLINNGEINRIKWKNEPIKTIGLKMDIGKTYYLEYAEYGKTVPWLEATVTPIKEYPKYYLCERNGYKECILKYPLPSKISVAG